MRKYLKKEIFIKLRYIRSLAICTTLYQENGAISNGEELLLEPCRCGALPGADDLTYSFIYKIPGRGTIWDMDAGG